ncbi:MAG: glycosyltransferase family 39 protein, partial [Eubacteriales bacterium]
MRNRELQGRITEKITRNWHIIVLALIALFSFWLYFYAISSIGFGNAYYAAAIKSMTESSKNFFFVSFDPAGLVSVDKPPLGLWIQALSVQIFGYSGWAMLLPQALAGTGSTIMMYSLTAKYFGRPAGLISALVFALTPAVAVASRNNTMDMQLIFVLLVSAWFLFKAIEKSRWRYLFICAIIIGLGFNIKMLQAYMILPAVAAVYLIFSKEKIAKRIIAAAISLVILGGVSFAWVL